MRSGLHSSLFFTVSRIWFLLVKLACMAISTGLWHRISNSPPLACVNLFPLRGVQKPGDGLGSISMYKRGLCQGLVVPLWLRGLTWRVGLRLVQVARSLLVVVSLPVLLIVKEGGLGLVAFFCGTVLGLIILICSFSGWYVFPIFTSLEKHYF